MTSHSKLTIFLVFKMFHKLLRTSANKHRTYLVRILSRRTNLLSPIKIKPAVSKKVRCYIFKYLAKQKNNYLMYQNAISKLFIIELKRL